MALLVSATVSRALVAFGAGVRTSRGEYRVVSLTWVVSSVGLVSLGVRCEFGVDLALARVVAAHVVL